jgi:hypothetical protein
MRPVALLLAALTLLSACAGYCPTDNAGVERSPWSAAPDAHKGTASR